MSTRNWTEDRNACEAATPGPWSAFCDGREMPNTNIVSVNPRTHCVCQMSKDKSHPDVVFVGMARDALPFWLDEAKRLREAIHTMMKTAARGHVPEDVYDAMVCIRNAALRGEDAR